MNNGHHGEGADSLDEDTLHDKADTRGYGEGVLRSHAEDGFYQSENRRQESCGV